MTLSTIHQFKAKTGNNVSEFMHSNWMTKYYYLGPKHKSSRNVEKCSPISMKVSAQLTYSHGYFVNFPHGCTPVENPHH